MQEGEILVTVIEYSKKENRVMVRGIFRRTDDMPETLDKGNYQNKVQCFLGADMGANVGFQFDDDMEDPDDS